MQRAGKKSIVLTLLTAFFLFLMAVFTVILINFYNNYKKRIVFIAGNNGFDISPDGKWLVSIISNDDSSKLQLLSFQHRLGDKHEEHEILRSKLKLRNPHFLDGGRYILVENHHLQDLHPSDLLVITINGITAYHLFSDPRMAWRILSTASRTDVMLLSSTAQRVRQDFTWYWDWDAETRFIAKLNGGQVLSVPANKFEACSSDALMWIRKKDVDRIEIVKWIKQSWPPKFVSIKEFHIGSGHSFSFSWDNSVVAFVYYDKNRKTDFIKIIKIFEGKISTVPYSEGRHNYIRFSHDNKFLIVSGYLDYSGQVGLWKISLGGENKPTQIN